jgi:hypothetical protein
MSPHAGRTTWDSRRILLGDWSRVVRDGIDLLRLVLLVGAVVFAVRGDPGGAALLVSSVP